MDYDWNALPRELRRRANEIYEATGLDLSLLHQIAHRLETSRAVTFVHEEYINGVRFDPGEYLIKRVSTKPNTDVSF